MRYVLLLLVSFIGITRICAQASYAEIGAVGSFFKQYETSGHAFGGQFTVNQQFATGILLGAGVQALQFSKPFQFGFDDHKGYYPLFARVGYNLSASRFLVSIHAEEGYAFYKNTSIGPADGPVPVRGGLYFSPGIALYGKKRFSPYLDLRYTRYQFRTDYGISKNIKNIHAFTVSLGLCILQKGKK